MIKNIFDRLRRNELSKLNVLLGIVFSPIVFLLLINGIHLSKVIYFYLEHINDLDSMYLIALSAPLLIGFVQIFIDFHSIYKNKIFYMLSISDVFIFLINLLFLMIILSYSFAKLTISGILIVFMINCGLAILVYLNHVKTKGIRKDDNKNFKLVFFNCKDFEHIIVFIRNIKITYCPEYILFQRYKISYYDAFNIELQFDKKLYDFNKDELDVLTMYAIK